MSYNKQENKMSYPTNNISNNAQIDDDFFATDDDFSDSEEEVETDHYTEIYNIKCFLNDLEKDKSISPVEKSDMLSEKVFKYDPNRNFDWPNEIIDNADRLLTLFETQKQQKPTVVKPVKQITNNDEEDTLKLKKMFLYDFQKNAGGVRGLISTYTISGLEQDDCNQMVKDEIIRRYDEIFTPDEGDIMDITDITTDDIREYKYFCSALNIGVNGTSIVSAYGNTGKSLFVQLMFLCNLYNKQFLGTFKIDNKGNVLHLDYDNPTPDQSKKYYSQLKNGLFAIYPELTKCKPKHKYNITNPKFYLDSPGAEEKLLKLTKGYAAVVIDSLRAACKADEDKSNEMRPIMDMLNRVAAANECSIIVLHHEAKGSLNQKGGDSRTKSKGSEAITSAAGSHIRLFLDDGKIWVENPRSRGEKFQAFSFKIDGVGDYNEKIKARDGITLTMMDKPGQATIEAITREESCAIAILEFISKNPQCSTTDIDRLKGFGTTMRRGVKKQLIDDGFIEVERKGANTHHNITEAGKERLNEFELTGK